jgi:hypothetical protein
VRKFSLLIFLSLTACHVARFSEFRGEKLDTDRATLAEGKKAAEKFCVSCHLLPLPESMTQETAHYMLAYMGLMLGVDASRQLDAMEREQFRNRYEYLKKSKLIPEHPLPTPNEWRALRSWYLGMARYAFASSEDAKPASLEAIPFADQGVTMLVRLKDGMIAAGGGATGTLFLLDEKLKTVYSFRLDSPPVHLVEKPEGLYVLTLGSLLGALGDEAASTLWLIDRKRGSSHALTRTLPRAAHFVMTDLNADGREDFVIAGFGSVTGGGVIACLRTGSTCTQQILSRQNSVVRLALLGTGAKIAQLLALSGGAREELTLLEYDSGVVREEKLAEFAPHLGSVWLETGDLDGDGEKEVLVLSGDNADAGAYNEVKPDQGLRIYELRGKQLTQKAFESLPGALSFTLFERGNGRAIAVARFYTDPQRRQDVTLLEWEKNFRFRRTHFSLPSRPTLLLPLDPETLLVGAGNLPLSALIDGRVQVRQFSGPVLGQLKFPTK